MYINYLDDQVIISNKSIFLAGPTPKNNSIVSWRKEAIRLLEEKGYDGVVYVPENSDDSVMHDQQKQIEWENEALYNASVIAFWIPRRLPTMLGLNTNVEFGYYLQSKKCLYGRPDNSQNNKYLDWLYELDSGLVPMNNLDELMDKSIEKCNKGIYERKLI